MGTECGCGFDKYCPHDTKRTQFFDDNLKRTEIQLPGDDGPSFRREPNQPSKYNRNKFPPVYYYDEDKGLAESYIPCGESSSNIVLIIFGVIFFIATISTMVIILNKG